jgi:VanZ family protein
MDAKRAATRRTSSSRLVLLMIKFYGVIAANSDNILQVAGITAVLLIGVVSLLPGALRPQTGVPGQFEHLIAYFGASVVLAFRADLSPRWSVSLLLVPYAGGLELAQLFIPGRHARLSDFLFNSIGAALGTLAAIGISAIGSRLLSRPPVPGRERV